MTEKWLQQFTLWTLQRSTLFFLYSVQKKVTKWKCTAVITLASDARLCFGERQRLKSPKASLSVQGKGGQISRRRWPDDSAAIDFSFGRDIPVTEFLTFARNHAATKSNISTLVKALLFLSNGARRSASDERRGFSRTRFWGTGWIRATVHIFVIRVTMSGYAVDTWPYDFPNE